MYNDIKVGDYVLLEHDHGYADKQLRAHEELQRMAAGEPMKVTSRTHSFLRFLDKPGGWYAGSFVRYRGVAPEVDREVSADTAKDPVVGAKYDSGKLLVSALFRGCAVGLEAVAEVLTFGAKKYAEDSWKTVPNAIKRYENALGRHFLAFNKGEEFDPETGLPHLAHIATNALFLIELRKEAAQGVPHTTPTFVDTSKWIDHDGGVMPVPAGTRVDIRYRDGTEMYDLVAGDYGSLYDAAAGRWEVLHCGPCRLDIVAYRVIQDLRSKVVEA